MSPYLEEPASADTMAVPQVSTKRLQAAARKAARDFRSDVVTVPNMEIMQAILNASFNDDIYDPQGDPSVNALQDKLKEMTGMEDALWAISVLLDHRAHIHCWESGALPVISQASVTSVHPSNGVHLTLPDVKKHMIADGNIHFPPTRVVALENTMSGVILPLKDAKEISEYVRSYPVSEGEKPVAMHLDAARLFDGVIGEGVDLKEYCKCFDSMSICLAKGIGAPMGSIILGTKAFIQRAKWFRKMLGGGARQPGMMAAAALAALNYSIPRFPQVHALAKRTGTKLEEIGYTLALPVQTNMVVIDLVRDDIPGAAFVKACASEELTVFPNGRLVFHHQTDDGAVGSLIKALEQLMSDKKAGRQLDNDEMQGGCS